MRKFANRVKEVGERLGSDAFEYQKNHSKEISTTHTSPNFPQAICSPTLKQIFTTPTTTPRVTSDLLLLTFSFVRVMSSAQCAVLAVPGGAWTVVLIN